jgi:hypothetical protein
MQLSTELQLGIAVAIFVLVAAKILFGNKKHERRASPPQREEQMQEEQSQGFEVCSVDDLNEGEYAAPFRRFVRACFHALFPLTFRSSFFCFLPSRRAHISVFACTHMTTG